jgi:heme exporter protein CcmD
MSAFFAMGGYGRFVWPSIGLAIAVLSWNVWAARRQQAAARLRAARALTMAEIDS